MLKSYYTCCIFYSILDINKDTFASVSKGRKLCSICH
jgi:hypothetical protein